MNPTWSQLPPWGRWLTVLLVSAVLFPVVDNLGVLVVGLAVVWLFSLPQLGSSASLPVGRRVTSDVALVLFAAVGAAALVATRVTAAAIALGLVGVAIAVVRLWRPMSPVTPFAVSLPFGLLGLLGWPASLRWIVAYLLVTVVVVVWSHLDQQRAAAPGGRLEPDVARRFPRVLTALALAVLVTVLLKPLMPVPSAGTASEPGDAVTVPTYWGFGDTLDTSVRTPLPDHEALRVRAPVRGYWTVTRFDVWDGRTWSKSWVDRDQEFRLSPSGIEHVNVPPIASSAFPVDTLRQSHRLLVGSMRFLPAAPDAARLETTDMYVAFDPDGSVRVQPVGPGSRWTVDSERSAVTADGLRDLGFTGPGATDPALVSSHWSVSREVEALAAEITAGATSTYDQLDALERWLRSNIERGTAPVPAPGEDPVSQTLFADRRGGGDQVATAFAMMSRSLGIPTRIAVGYTPDHRDEVSSEWVSRVSDGHAWIEAHLGGAGWVPFDPLTDIPLPGGSRDPWYARLLTMLEQSWPMLLGVAVVVALGLAASRVLRWRTAVLADTNRGLRRLIRRFERIVARRSRPRAPAETLLEYVHAAAPTEHRESANAVADALSDAAFGPADAADEAALEVAVTRLRSSWPAPPRRHRLRRRS